MDLDHNYACTTENKAKASTIYFGVHIPNDTANGQPNVFEDKESALKAAKKHKKSRFKSFQFYHEAVDFSINGSEVSCVEGGDGEKKELASGIGEKASPFRTPRPQELTEFRGKIENGQFSCVREMVDYNPRYLVSSGDTPSILQEGARLNALHVAAKVRNAEIVEYVLNTISNPEFIKKLYGDDNQENAEQRCKMLLDLYLNTPNKGFNDTPLHIASKWGADKVVDILLTYPECDKMKRNKHDKLAEDVICERVDAKTPVSVKKRIQQLLCDNYYVPVLRTEDNTLPPVVGEPFSPASPPVLNRDPLSPRLEIHAYAGPMDKTEAESFRRVWKTPPRSLNFNSPNGKKTPIDNLTSLRLKDPEKGLERIGKKLANNYNFNWKEYWDFLDSFVDIASEDGLDMLESYLKSKQKHLQEVFSPLVAQPETVVSPITSLCNAFSACRIGDSDSVFLTDWKSPIGLRETCRPLVYVDKACQVFANRIFGNVSSILSCSEGHYETAAKTLEADVKLLELLINSYMDDERFSEWVNFQKVHSRLAHLIHKKLQERHKDEPSLINQLEAVLETIVKKSDYFSSDDEAPNCKEHVSKATSYRKQVVCLLSKLKSTLESPIDCPQLDDNHFTVDAWQPFNACNCIFHPRKPKRNNLSRSSSFKNNHANNRKQRKYDIQSVSKKLCFGEDDSASVGTNGELGFSLSSDSSKSDSDDEFYTPPSSPNESADTSDCEEFGDAESLKVDMFLEGPCPTKTDYAVFNALRYADCDIDRMKYPNVYRWHHCINLYRESEREGWPSLHDKPTKEPDNVSPTRHCPPQKPSWLRITGCNSPRAAIKSFNHRQGTQ